jgi:Xaa-Pro aminopeptidase
MSELHDSKLSQAQSTLKPGQVWLIAARESLERPEPGLTLLVGAEVTWDSFFLVTPRDAIAIVGRYDADAIPASWRVIGYDEDAGPVLRSELAKLGPETVMLNYSSDDPLCDGLTHGLYLRLRELLPDVAFSSASDFLGSLRSRKTPLEQAAILEAAQYAEDDLDALEHTIRVGWSERDVAYFLHDRLRAEGCEPSWGWAGCPTVKIGPVQPSHAGPTDRQIEPGLLMHIDYGARLPHGYGSDIQRVFYWLKPDQDGLPPELERAFTATWNAIEAAAKTLRPGVQGFEVDAAARSSLVNAGYPEYLHAVGHGLGRATHDGGTLLGPRWARYGSKPEGIVAEGEVYTLELGAFVEGYGYVGLEEDVLVRVDGVEWFSRRQNKIRLLGQ